MKRVTKEYYFRLTIGMKSLRMNDFILGLTISKCRAEQLVDTRFEKKISKSPCVDLKLRPF